MSVSTYQGGSLSIDRIKLEEKSFGSTDSGIAQETHTDKSSDIDTERLQTPPPPHVDKEDTKPPIEIPPPVVSQPPEESEDNRSAEPVPAETTEKIAESSIQEPAEAELKPDPEISEIDWQYQLPSPPKAFRDSSPANFPADEETSVGQSVTDCKDSVVTSPELFEKLKLVEDSQSEKGTTSDLTSVVSEEEKPLLNTLSLENLEKRKSLVYNRELATSLKMTDILEPKETKVETFTSSLTQFESTYNEISKSSLPRETEVPKYRNVTATTHTLPNFKISTYDQPKQKIKVFEDDTIRSNTDSYIKTKNETYVEKSATVTVRKGSLEGESNYLRDGKMYRTHGSAMPRSFGPMSSIFRSESFSTENSWTPGKPVSRSKSQLTLNSNKYKEEKTVKNGDDMSRSNSFFDVSGLQSLEVSSK